MRPEAFRETLYRERLVAIHRTKDPEGCLKQARALRDGGIRIQEITWTSADAPRLVRELSRSKLGVVGAGTILRTSEAKEAIDAGAQFLVSPVFSKGMNAWAKRRKIPYMAGACTPQEIWEAWEEGVRPIKLFPSPEPCTPAYVRRVLTVMPFLELVPTGVGIEHVKPYLDAGARAVGLMVSLLAAGTDRLVHTAAHACGRAQRPVAVPTR